MFKKREKKGLFIGFIGVPGVGKSTLAQALATELEAYIFIEPGEEAWPVEPKEWEKHVDELETWLCASNLAKFTEARQIADRGGTAVADGGIFLVNRVLMNAACYDWYYGLLSKSGREEIAKNSERDWLNAPCPDFLVLLETDNESWIRFLKERGRGIDTCSDSLKAYAAQQVVIAKAAKEFATARGITLIQFENTYGSVKVNAKALLSKIVTCKHNTELLADTSTIFM